MNPAGQQPGVLWARLEGYAFDPPGVSATFADRLIRETAWSRARADRAILEYRRFVYLCLTVGHEVCPSDEVDQVWHLHLTDTRAYWDEFCGQVLGRPLHHRPSRGGAGELSRHQTMYRRTLVAYRQAFGENPPAELWPSVERRFEPGAHNARVRLDRHWLVPHPRLSDFGRAAAGWRSLIWSMKRSLPCLAAAAALLLGLYQVNAFAGWGVLDLRGPDFLRLFWSWTVLAFILACGLRWWLRQPGGRTKFSVHQPDPYMVAIVAEGEARAANALIAQLTLRGLLHVDESFVLTAPSTEGSDNALENAAIEEVRQRGQTTVAELRDELVSALRPLAERARSLGLVVSKEQQGRVILWPLLIALAVPVLGLCKLAIGLSRDKPVGLLILSIIVVSLVGLIGFFRRVHASRRGSRWLRELRREHHSLKKKVQVSVSESGGARLALGVALFGTSLAAMAGIDHLQRALTPPAGHSSGCSDGCSDGDSDGDGGGCGGCGD